MFVVDLLHNILYLDPFGILCLNILIPLDKPFIKILVDFDNRLILRKKSCTFSNYLI